MTSKKEYLYKSFGAEKSILYSWFDAMNTRVDIVLCNRLESDSLRIIDEIYDKIVSIERIGNCFDLGSEITLVNNIASNGPLKISKELFTIISQMKYYNKMTLGYFDVTVHSEDYNKELINKVVLDEKVSTIYFERKGIRINLSGFLKGYALDTISRILSDNDIADALINMGDSSVMAKGNHPYGEGWKIGLGKSEKQTREKTVLLKDQCLTTSGNYNSDRKHIINPHSNSYIEGEKSISVVTNKASDGEALSTALFAAPESDHKSILTNFEATILN